MALIRSELGLKELVGRLYEARGRRLVIVEVDDDGAIEWSGVGTKNDAANAASCLLHFASSMEPGDDRQCSGCAERQRRSAAAFQALTEGLTKEHVH